MCLNVIYPRKVKTLPKEFTAYKVVEKKSGRYYFPIWNSDIKIRKTQALPVMMDVFDRATKGGRYLPYYHSFRTIAACIAVEKHCPDTFAFIKIKIKRRDVTCVGGQGEKGLPPYYQTIVSKAFTTDFDDVTKKVRNETLP